MPFFLVKQSKSQNKNKNKKIITLTEKKNETKHNKK
jgi:hypothetical protein